MENASMRDGPVSDERRSLKLPASHSSHLAPLLGGCFLP